MDGFFRISAAAEINNEESRRYTRRDDLFPLYLGTLGEDTT